MGPGDGGPKTTEDRMAPFEPTGVRKWFIDNTMLVITLFGVLTGIGVGFGLRPYNLGPDPLIVISYPGELFMRLLKLMILPLIIASLIAGSASLNAKMSGKIAVRTLLYFISTSMFNAFLGILIAMLIHPGKPDLREDIENVAVGKRDHNILDNLLDIGRNIFPDNIVQAAFQQAHTVYTEPTNVFAKNSSDTLPTLVRVVSYSEHRPPSLNTRALRYAKQACKPPPARQTKSTRVSPLHEASSGTMLTRRTLQRD